MESSKLIDWRTMERETRPKKVNLRFSERMECELVEIEKLE